MTKKENFAIIRDIIENSDFPERDDILAFIDYQVELITKKATYRSETKTQKENRVLVEDIYRVIAELDAPITCGDLRNTAFPNLSIPKVSSMLSKLVNAGRVTRTYEKKVPYFSAS